MPKPEIKGSIRPLVNVYSGEVRDFFVAEPQPVSWAPGNPETRAWLTRDLTKSGQPDRRSRGVRVGVRRLLGGGVIGQWAEVSTGRELAAVFYRNRVKAAEEALRAAKGELEALHLD